MSRLVYPSSGQYTLLRLVNLTSWPFILFTCVSSIGFNSVLICLALGAAVILAWAPLLSVVSLISCLVSATFSLTTSVAFLSVRMPSKDGCRNTPSEVTSVKLTSQTSLGFSQVAVALGGLGRNCDGLLISGSEAKGILLL